MELDPKYDNFDFPTTSPVAQSGHPGHLTDGQQAQVHQLRLMLEAEGYTKRLDTLTLVCLPALTDFLEFPRVVANVWLSCSFAFSAPASSMST